MSHWQNNEKTEEKSYVYAGEKNVIKILTLLRCGEKKNNYKEKRKREVN